eukprot:768486-Hanusia_phi.AAC.3
MSIPRLQRLPSEELIIHLLCQRKGKSMDYSYLPYRFAKSSHPLVTGHVTEAGIQRNLKWRALRTA